MTKAIGVPPPKGVYELARDRALKDEFLPNVEDMFERFSSGM